MVDKIVFGLFLFNKVRNIYYLLGQRRNEINGLKLSNFYPENTIEIVEHFLFKNKEPSYALFGIIIS